MSVHMGEAVRGLYFQARRFDGEKYLPRAENNLSGLEYCQKTIQVHAYCILNLLLSILLPTSSLDNALSRRWNFIVVCGGIHGHTAQSYLLCVGYI